MNQKLEPIPFLLSLSLAACLGGDPEGDGGEDITHAPGHWELQWECDQQGERLVGCSVGDIYEAPPDADGTKRLGVAWEGSQATGTLQANALSVTFEHGPQNTPEYYTEEAIYTFDRTNLDYFTKSSTYRGTNASGVCTGSGKRIPASQTTCVPTL